MTTNIITPAAKYKTVLEAVRAGAAVTQTDLDEANAYAKKAKRGQIKDATIVEFIETKTVRNTKNAGVVCDGDDTEGCDRDAKAMGMCMKHYIRKYRKDEANRERANAASRKYAEKKRAAKANKA